MRAALLEAMRSFAWPRALVWLGAALLLVALGMVLRALAMDGEGFEDLGLIAGAVLLAGIAGILGGAGLLAAGSRLPPLERGLGTLVAGFGLVAAFLLLRVSLPSGNWGLSLFAVVIGVLALVGLVAGLRGRHAAACPCNTYEIRLPRHA